MASGEVPVRERLQAWLNAVMRRLEPDQLKIPAGRTLGDAVAAVLAEEEIAARTSDENDLRGPKLEMIRKLRDQFGLPGGQAEVGVYELAMGGLEDVPLGRLADILELWQKIVQGVGGTSGTPADQLAPQKRVQVELAAGGERELVATFRGTPEMVRHLRSYLKEAGIEEGPA